MICNGLLKRNRINLPFAIKNAAEGASQLQRIKDPRTGEITKPMTEKQRNGKHYRGSIGTAIQHTFVGSVACTGVLMRSLSTLQNNASSVTPLFVLPQLSTQNGRHALAPVTRSIIFLWIQRYDAMECLREK
jgi:hypothetical protein